VRNNAQIGSLPIAVAPAWRVAHAYNSTLPGWLVVIARRHVEALHELGPAEGAALGEVLYRTSTSLRTVLGCEKFYVMFFGEKEGHSHLHFHVVPRSADLPPDAQGPGVMMFINRADDEWISPRQQDAVARRLADEMERLQSVPSL
jgi:diadenosine tetraphosphate (Ap4A) HIT family hydrolase